MIRLNNIPEIILKRILFFCYNTVNLYNVNTTFKRVILELTKEENKKLYGKYYYQMYLHDKANIKPIIGNYMSQNFISKVSDDIAKIKPDILIYTIINMLKNRLDVDKIFTLENMLYIKGNLKYDISRLLVHCIRGNNYKLFNELSSKICLKCVLSVIGDNLRYIILTGNIKWLKIFISFNPIILLATTDRNKIEWILNIDPFNSEMIDILIGNLYTYGESLKILDFFSIAKKNVKLHNYLVEKYNRERKNIEPTSNFELLAMFSQNHDSGIIFIDNIDLDMIFKVGELDIIWEIYTNDNVKITVEDKNVTIMSSIRSGNEKVFNIIEQLYSAHLENFFKSFDFDDLDNISIHELLLLKILKKYIRNPVDVSEYVFKYLTCVGRNDSLVLLLNYLEVVDIKDIENGYTPDKHYYVRDKLKRINTIVNIINVIDNVFNPNIPDYILGFHNINNVNEKFTFYNVENVNYELISIIEKNNLPISTLVSLSVHI